MSIFNGLLIAAFLILLAASAAVVGSMMVLGLFDLAVRTERPPSVSAEITEGDIEMTSSLEANEVSTLEAKVPIPDQMAA